MTPADIRKLARQNEVGGTDIDRRTAAALYALADVVEAAYIEEDAGPMYAALARVEALKP